MKKLLLIVALAAFVAFSGCQKDESVDQIPNESFVELADAKNGELIPDHYVVVLDENKIQFKSSESASYEEKQSEMKRIAESILSSKSYADYKINYVYGEAIKGFAVKLPKDQVEILKKDGRVKYIEQDFYISKKPDNVGKPDPPATSGQETPWGITRVGGPLDASNISNIAWIIDSGIDLDHPDLNVNVAKSKNFINPNKTADDDNGHGTHCAGTVAAIDNNIGVVGVAAGATVVAVKVLDRKGSGTLSGVIAGVNYVAANASAGDAANMSLSGGIATSLDDAVYNASQNGIYFALGAGNDSHDANNNSPARKNGPNIYTISAMDSSDDWAWFSNYGSPVDYCEPGVAVKSTFKNGGYKIYDGTSMAAPHMCGILLMTGGNPTTSGYVTNDPSSPADPIGHL